MSKKYETILFDMDGVLLDSRPSMKLAWNIVSKKHCLNIDFERYLVHLGLPFENILAELEISDQIHSQIKQDYSAAVVLHSSSTCLYRGIRYVFSCLNKLEFNVGIVTSKEFWRADYICDKFGLKTDIVVTPEFTKKGKPYPDPLIKALEILDSSADRSVYVGDMNTDMLAAMSAEMDFLHAEWGYGECSTKNKIDFPEELLDYLIT